MQQVLGDIDKSQRESITKGTLRNIGNSAPAKKPASQDSMTNNKHKFGFKKNYD
jgi:hypothetical protein